MLLKRHSALLLFVAVVGLCCFGLVMLYSASAFSRQAEMAGDPFHFLKTQAVCLGLGLLICGAISFVDYRLWWRQIIWIGLGCLVLLALCYVPGVRHVANHEARWIKVGPLIGQPSELAKVALLIFLAGWYDAMRLRRRTFMWGLLLPGVAAALPIGLIVFEKDIGTALLLAAVTGVVMFAGGVPMRLLVVAMVLAGGGIGVVVAKYPEKAKRVLVWLNKDDPEVKAARWQQEQAKIALGSGGIEGVGFGDSRQKMLFLPEAHTDFIFAIIGEELGLRATLTVVAFFVMFMIAGGFIASRAPDLNGALLGTGAVVMLGLQAFINIGVVTEILPNKGISLPFMSAGGSGMLATLAMVGLLVSIAKRSEGVDEDEEEEEPARGRARRSWFGGSPSPSLPGWLEEGHPARSRGGAS